jgi:hypothetical protein
MERYANHGWHCMGLALSRLEAMANNPPLASPSFATKAVQDVRSDAESITDYTNLAESLGSDRAR